MKSKITSTVIGVSIVIAIGNLVFWQKNSVSESPTSAVSSLPGTKETKKEAIAFTLAQIAEHNSRTSCWSIINGNVYDLTSWIPNHPGGELVILQLCGIDGSEKYDRKHGNRKKPAMVLTGFKIGTLVQ